MRSTSVSVISVVAFQFFLLLSCSGFSIFQDIDDCPPSSCGSLQNISYPFRLRTDPPECGDPTYELRCEGNYTLLNLPSGEYHVTDISYYENTIRLVDIGFVNGTCGLPRGSFLSNELLNDQRFRFEEGQWASFMNCTKKINDSSYDSVPCLSSSNSSVYVRKGYHMNTLLYLPPSCRFISMVPMSYMFEQYSSLVGDEDIFKLLQMGFNLLWRKRQSRAAMCAIQAFQDTIGLGILSRILVPMTPITFLSCLMDYDREFSNSRLIYDLTIVSAIISHVRTILTVLAVLGRLVFAPLAVLIFLAYKRWGSRMSLDIVEKFLQSQESLTPTRFLYNEIIMITRNFSEKLGQGGFGSVFKGVLPGGHLIAVKVLNNSKFSGEEFINEVSTIGRIHHVNIVQLIGFCSERDNRALVYELMPNGSLDKYVLSSNTNHHSLISEKLNDIALGVARAIDYLHRGCDKQILHFDIKPHNILLDQNFNPKVSDFGLAKLYPKDCDLVSVSAARGTIGYIAPELISRNFGVVSHKSDVYSFGMLLMKLAGMNRNLAQQVDCSSGFYYPSWIYDKINQREEPEITNDFDITELERKLCVVGLWCIQMNPSDRPSMNKVIEMLEGDTEALQMPPKPFFSTPRSISLPQPCSDSSFTELSIISECE